MEIANYQPLAMRTSPEGHNRILNGCMGLIGEAGEIVDLVKKWKFQSGDNAELPVNKLIDECGDVLWYCAELATGLGENLADMYATAAEEFDDMHERMSESEIEVSAGRLAMIAVRPFYSYDIPEPVLPEWKEVRVAEMKSDIVGMMVAIRDFLEIYCKVTMSGAMDYNIAKLRNRYPDGFDPECSLHREQEATNE